MVNRPPRRVFEPEGKDGDEIRMVDILNTFERPQLLLPNLLFQVDDLQSDRLAWS